MTTLLIAKGELIAVTIVRAVLDPWAPSPATSEARRSGWMMQTIAPPCF
jgi:hypothetical protein